MSVYESRWATASGSSPRHARLAWRKRNGVPDSVSDSTVSPPQLGPSLNIVDGEGSGTKPAPTVMSHYEQLYFGRYGTVNVTPGVEAEMTFIGDVGEIQLGNITITRKDGGRPFTTTGNIASGAGQMLSCADVTVTQCGNSRHLSGVLLLDGAPVCDASGNGNVNYSANNLASSLGLQIMPLGSSNGIAASWSTNGAIGMAAPPCDNVTPPSGGDETGGETSQPTGGTGAAPSPDPWEPPPVPPPPKDDNDGPTTWYCSGVIVSQIIDGQSYFLAEAQVCYRA
jgi:hypothetical protein